MKIKQNILQENMKNWEKTSIEKVMALIEVKVTPQRGRGFDNIADVVTEWIF